MTPPRIRGLVQRFEKCVRMEFHDKANRPARKRETAAARIDVLWAFAVVATPPASPDVEGLVKALERIAEKCSDPDTTDALDTALSTWRQAQV